MRTTAAIVVAALWSSNAIAADIFCDHLREFVRAPFVTASARSVEFYWTPAGILGTQQCVNEGQESGKQFCTWLIKNTNQEFMEMLPEDVLRCYGFDFPRVPNVDDWKATYQFVDVKSLRWLVLEVRIAQSDAKYDGGVRISVLPDKQDTATNPLPVFPDPPSVDDPKKQKN